MFNHVVLNFQATQALVRNEELDGRSYTVVPMVMMVEGVHNGTNGSLFYPESELAKTPAVWNGRPLVVYHPMLQGAAMSAGDPVVWNKQKIGYVMNTQWDGATKKLRAEAWIDTTKAALVDNRVIEAVTNGTAMEVSTGLFADYIPEAGVWNGENYTHVARNYRPDHLAILPDQVGACSLADGAGLLVANALSDDTARQQIRLELRDKFNVNPDGPYVYVEDMFPDFVVYELDNKLYRLPIARTEDSAVLVPNEMPEQVMRVTEYRTLQGSFVGNSTFQPHERIDMDKKQTVDALIANKDSGWEEKDRVSLMKTDDTMLEKLTANAAKATEAVKSAEANKPTEEVKTPSPQTQNAQTATTPAQPAQQQPAQPATLAEYLNSAPAELRGPLSEIVGNYEQSRQATIQRITANTNNVFTPEELGQMSLPQLSKIAAMATPAPAADAVVSNNNVVPAYWGQATAPTHNKQVHVEEGLDIPSVL